MEPQLNQGANAIRIAIEDIVIHVSTPRVGGEDTIRSRQGYYRDPAKFYLALLTLRSKWIDFSRVVPDQYREHRLRPQRS